MSDYGQLTDTDVEALEEFAAEYAESDMLSMWTMDQE